MSFRLPTDDKDIVDLAERLLMGIQNVPGLNSDPPVSPETLKSDLNAFRGALSDYEDKKVAAQDAAFVKNEGRLACVMHLRRLRDWAETQLNPEDPRLAQLGFAVQGPAATSAVGPPLTDAEAAPPGPDLE